MKATRAIVMLAVVSSIFAGAVFGFDRPTRHNTSYNPDAVTSSFGFVTTGVIIKVTGASIAKDGTVTANFTLTDANGAGLDVNGVYTAGVESLGFVVAYLPNGQSQYVAYTTTVDKALNSNPLSQIQAGLDTGGKYTLVDAASGSYTYTFGTKVPLTYDPAATHTIGAQVERNLAAYGIGVGTYYTSDSTYNFVPNGAAVTHVRDVVNEAACNGCHNPLNAHGAPGPRQKLAYCVLCHTPQSTNPDTLNTVDMKVFIHKIHMGSSLPSVVAGGKYQDRPSRRGSGFFDRCVSAGYSQLHVLPCFRTGAQAANWTTNPSRAICGSCHDDVNFATGQNHVNLIQSGRYAVRELPRVDGALTNSTRRFQARIRCRTIRRRCLESCCRS